MAGRLRTTTSSTGNVGPLAILRGQIIVWILTKVPESRGLATEVCLYLIAGEKSRKKSEEKGNQKLESRNQKRKTVLVLISAF